MSVQGVASDASCHGATLFRKVAKDDHRVVAERLTVGSRTMANSVAYTSLNYDVYSVP